MKYAAVLLVAFACSFAFASEPGQPIDCSDWEILVPGFAWVDRGDSPPSGGSEVVVANDGSFLWVTGNTCDARNGCLGHVELHQTSGSNDRVIARISGREVGRDVNGIMLIDSISAASDFAAAGLPNRAAFMFDAGRGDIIIPLRGDCNYWNGQYNQISCQFPGGCRARITGFATTFDVLQTFSPQSELGFRVPLIPEGLPAADHFDTYWGPLTKPLDFTQAHALQCDYPAAQPHAGDYLTVNDTLPDPAPGTGRYYVTAATYQGQTRYGRKTTAGHLSGRDPAVLPACSSFSTPTP